MASTTKVTAEHAQSDLSEVYQLRQSFNKLVADIELLRGACADGLLQNATVAVSAAAEKVKTTTTLIGRVDGIQCSKAATDNIVFSAADTINTAGDAGQFWGAWLLMYNPTTDAFATMHVAANQVYATEAAALAAVPAPDAHNVAVAYVSVQSKEATKWTATTDDLTAASDCAAVGFHYPATVGAPSALAALTATLVKAFGES